MEPCINNVTEYRPGFAQNSSIPPKKSKPPQKTSQYITSPSKATIRVETIRKLVKQFHISDKSSSFNFYFAISFSIPDSWETNRFQLNRNFLFFCSDTFWSMEEFWDFLLGIFGESGNCRIDGFSGNFLHWFSGVPIIGLD